jgi:hypothetical protein
VSQVKLDNDKSGILIAPEYLIHLKREDFEGIMARDILEDEVLERSRLTWDIEDLRPLFLSTASHYPDGC